MVGFASNFSAKSRNRGRRRKKRLSGGALPDAPGPINPNPVAATTPIQQPQQQPITSVGQIGSSAVDQTLAGAGLLGASQTLNPLLQENAQLGQSQFDRLGLSSQDFLKQVQHAIQLARDPTLGSNVQSLLDGRRQSRLSDVENLFTPDSARFGQATRELAGISGNALGSGLSGSSAQAQANAGVQQRFNQDRSAAIQAANELSRREELAQLDQLRNTDLNSASLLGGLSGQQLSAAQNALQLSNQAAGTSGNLDLSSRQLGAGILQSGLSNQLASIFADAQLKQQEFDNLVTILTGQNQANQQNVENIQAKKQSDLIKQQLQKLVSSQDSGGGLLGAFGL